MLLWWLEGSRRLSRRARAAIADDGAAVHVSAASAWEIATKYRLGKLPGVEPIIGRLPATIADQAFEPLDITIRHAEVAGALSGAHRDPFDRMLIAQSRLEGLDIVSNEKLFDDYGVTRVW